MKLKSAAELRFWEACVLELLMKNGTTWDAMRQADELIEERRQRLDHGGILDAL